VRDLAGANWPHVALFGGSDVTGLDVSAPDGRLESAVRVGVRSEEGPRDVAIRGDLLADGVGGFGRVLEGQLRAVR
jgi:trehalose 6-phosphate phosphatase